MKSRFILFRRAGVFYCEDTTTRKQTSLRTKDENEALSFLRTKNEAVRQPAMNLQMAQVYLQHSDSEMAQRTWQSVMDTMAPLKIGPTQSRWIIWSGIFVYVFEEDWYQKALDQNLDTLDGLVNAEVQEETVKHFQQPQPEQKQRSLEETAGIATGIAPDIEKQVELRKAKRRPAPDNLAKTELS
jgi:hypothetical protein